MSSSEPPPEPTSTPAQNGAKTGKGHHPNSRKNLLPSGPGRSKGSRNRFSKEAVARFVDQYRADLAADWDKHGDQFIAKCREFFPQIYATMQRMRLEDELSRQAAAGTGPITITWATQATPPPIEREPPKQLTYGQPELPGDLTPSDWQKLLAILEVVKRVAPSDAAPTEVLETVRAALLQRYADK